MKKIWQWIVAAFIFLTGALLWQRRRVEQAEGELISSKAKLEDAPLAERERAAKEAADAERAKLNQLTPPKDVKDMTPDEVKDYWKNR